MREFVMANRYISNRAEAEIYLRESIGDTCSEAVAREAVVLLRDTGLEWGDDWGAFINSLDEPTWLKLVNQALANAGET